MKVFALYTGGKDSTYALIKAIDMGYHVDATLTFISENPYSYMLHTPNTRWTILQSVSMGLKHHVYKSSGIKDKELKEIFTAFKMMREMGYEGVVSGAVLSKYQKTRIDSIARKVGLESIAPLWGYDQTQLLKDLIKSGIEYMIVRVAARGLTRQWLGKIIKTYEDTNRLVELANKYGFNPSGEGGEYETFVVDSPIFRYRIEVLDYSIIDDGDSQTLLIENAQIKKKK